MARQVSVTVTCGKGSERHNHDLEYREALDHTHTANTPDAIIELLPYRSYKEQINEMLKPYIDEYNEKVQQRYEAAWERYNNGEIKSKPRKANFKPMSYDYYDEHKDDTYYDQKTERNEPLPIWRSVIFGLGDKADRENGTITRDEAVSVMSGIVERWPEMYPDFKLLGATIHLDEEGFYHCHIDYKPLYSMDCGQGLTVGIGQEGALERMGYEPEQSLINERDKAPIRFNAFRNRLYLETEKELHTHGLRLLYGASKVKEPEKDSSVNKPLDAWQETKDRANDLQHFKNVALDIIERDEVSPEGFAEFTKAVSNLERTFDEVEKCDKQAFRNNRIVPFHLFDQMKTFKDQLKAVIGYFYKQIEQLKQQIQHLKETTVSRQQYDALFRMSPAAETEKARELLRQSKEIVNPELAEKVQFFEYAGEDIYGSQLWQQYQMDKEHIADSPEVKKIKELVADAEAIAEKTAPPEPTKSKVQEHVR